MSHACKRFEDHGIRCPYANEELHREDFDEQEVKDPGKGEIVEGARAKVKEPAVKFPFIKSAEASANVALSEPVMQPQIIEAISGGGAPWKQPGVRSNVPIPLRKDTHVDRPQRILADRVETLQGKTMGQFESSQGGPTVQPGVRPSASGSAESASQLKAQQTSALAPASANIESATTTGPTRQPGTRMTRVASRGSASGDDVAQNTAVSDIMSGPDGRTSLFSIKEAIIGAASAAIFSAAFFKAMRSMQQARRGQAAQRSLSGLKPLPDFRGGYRKGGYGGRLFPDAMRIPGLKPGSSNNPKFNIE